MNETRNYILAFALSLAVLLGWQFFISGPQLERAQQQAEQQQAQAEAEAAANGESVLPTPDGSAQSNATTTAQPGAVSAIAGTREELIAASDRVKIDTPSLTGSINLTGGRIDDLKLKKYRQTIEDDSPIVTLLSPAGSPHGYYAEQGWIGAGGKRDGMPGADTVWSVAGNDTLTTSNPVTLTWENENGLTFSRTISVDEDYLFTIEQSVANSTAGDVALFPYSLVMRQETPRTSGFFILHEGPIGVLGEKNLMELTYGNVKDDSQIDVEATGGWLGITDKYWATAVFPDPEAAINARFSYSGAGARDNYQTSYVGRSPIVVPGGGEAKSTGYLFAGAKVEEILDRYQQEVGVDRLELLIDWGWLHFITKPMFYLIKALYGVLGNFGLSILAVTVIIKILFFWFANKSYASMASMKKVQPEMKAIQERFKDDRAEQQKAMMELYKREKINPLAGCWPILIQIPVFFSLYKVLFITIEMRQAPFFGWIQDLAAPDPTTVFNLFGLLPYDPTVVPVIGGFLALGVWPLIMGITMFVQMRLNPPPSGPNAETQQLIFTWMPVVFTFMLAGFPAGLVIYWAWNNFLSVIQQYVIMRRHGVEVNLLGNIAAAFKRKKPDEGGAKS